MLFIIFALMKKIALNEYCPCCGYNTFVSLQRLEYEICPICLWEDDPLQFNDIALEFSANLVSLEQAQLNFEKYNASVDDMKRYCRKPNNNDKLNPEWI